MTWSWQDNCNSSISSCVEGVRYRYIDLSDYCDVGTDKLTTARPSTRLMLLLAGTFSNPRLTNRAWTAGSATALGDGCRCACLHAVPEETARALRRT